MAESRTIVDADGIGWIVAIWRPHIAPSNAATTQGPRLEFRSDNSRCFLPVGDYPPNWSALDCARLARLLELARLLGERGVVPAVFHFGDGRCQEHEVPDPAPDEYDVTEPVHVEATWEPGAIPRTARFVTHRFERRGQTSVGVVAQYDEMHPERH
jgi:hypothetical protein